MKEEEDEEIAVEEAEDEAAEPNEDLEEEDPALFDDDCPLEDVICIGLMLSLIL